MIKNKWIICTILLLLVVIVVVYYWGEDTAENQRQQDEIRESEKNHSRNLYQQGQAEFEKCNKDFLENIPVYNGTTIVSSGSCNYHGHNKSLIILVGNLTDIQPVNRGKINDIMKFSDGLRFPTYGAQKYSWIEGKVHRITIKVNKWENTEKVQSIEIIN